MIWKNLGFKGKATVVLLAGLILSIALIWYGIRAVNLVVEAEQVWADYNRTATATSQQMNRIHKHLGYGGFIHNFKNYILRADLKYLELLDTDKIEIDAAIAEYRSLNISDGERGALSRLSEVVQEYMLNAQDARISFAMGEDSEAIDYSVRVDDTPAIKALADLSDAALRRSRQSEYEAEMWLERTVSYLSWGLFIVPLVLFSAAVMIRFLWQSLRANDVAERAQQELEALLQTAPDAMLTINASGRIVRANQQAESLFGYSGATLRSMGVEELLPERNRESHVALRQSYFSKPRARPMGGGMELKGLTQDGREIPLEISLSTVQQAEGTLATATVRDISDRLAAQRQVRENEERLTLSQAIADVGTWDWDIATGGLIWSPQIYSIFGVSADQFEASYDNFLSVVHPDDRDKVTSAVREALEYDVLYDVEHRLILRNGKERYVHERGQVYRDENGAPVRMIGVVLDITERIRFVTALEKAKAEADRANKAKSDFLANMSHEIRTPMNAILGMGYLVLKTKLDHQQSDYLNKMMSSTRSLLRIINDILDFSKIEADKLEMENTPFALANVMESVANVIGASVDNKKLEIMFASGVDVPCALMGDPLRLEQVLINLAGNAVKFTESGEVVVRANLERIDEDGSAVLKFSVQDTGIGMDQTQVATLFDAFRQADTSTTRRFGGTGLGLSISLRLVKMMGGIINVESEAGKGSTFTFTARFGVLDDSNTRRYVPKDMEGAPALIVDDNETSREILCEIMNAFGFKCTSVSSGEAALAELQRAAATGEPFYKVVLMDWMMDGLDGLETTEKVRADVSLPAAPTIIMVTAYGRDMVMEQAKQVGLDGFLLKPVTPSALFDTIMDVLGRKDAQVGAMAHRQAQDVHSNALAGARILVVEDNPVNQQVAEEILSAGGATVEIAPDGDRAYRMICVEKENYDAVLMDLHMPVMDGYVATGLIRETYGPNDLSIIAMTANAMREERQKCLDAGMNDYITKPVDVEALYAMLLKWLPTNTAAEQPQQPQTRPIADITVDDMTLPESLDGFDLVDGLDRMLGRPELYLKFMLKLVEDHGDDARLVRESLQRGDRDIAHRLAHTTKGVSGNLSAQDLYTAATKLSDALKSDVEDVDGFLDTFEVELDRAVAAIRSLRAG